MFVFKKPYKIARLNYNSIVISFEFKEKVKFFSGQFFNIELKKNDFKVKRSYSICSSQNENIISFCIKEKPNGEFSKILFSSVLEDYEFLLEGPFGVHNSSKFMFKSCILIAIGSGISPIKSIIDTFISGKKIDLVYGNRYEEDILYKNYFDKLEKDNEDFNVRYVLSKPKKRFENVGYVQDFLENLDFEKKDIFICGKTKMVLEVMKVIKSKNLNCNVIAEFFG